MRLMFKTTACLALALAGCSAADSGSGSAGQTVILAPAPVAPAVMGTHGAIVSYFEGSFSVATRTMSIVYRAPAGELQPQGGIPIPPSGSGPTATVTMHTAGGTGYDTAEGCQAKSLCGNVQAVNGFSVPATFYAYIDSTVPSGMTGGPWEYLNVAANSSSSVQQWDLLDVSATDFHFSGHTEVVFANCKVLHTILPAVGSGVTEINPGLNTIPAYCDMTTAGGGWTQVFDENVDYPSFQAGYRSDWLSGVATTPPNGGQYSILNVLGASGAALKGAADYEFLFDWGSGGSLQWLQTDNPMAIMDVSPSGLSVLAQNPAGIAQTGTGCGSFAGLYKSNNGSAVMNADNNHGCWYFAVGDTAGWPGTVGGVGIPAYSNNNNPAMAEAKLYVR